MHRVPLLPRPASPFDDADNLVRQSAREARCVSDTRFGFPVGGFDDPVHGDASALTTIEGYGDEQGHASACGTALGADPHEWCDAVDCDFHVQGWV